MKKIIASLLALTLFAPLMTSAHPGGWGPGPGWHGGPGPARPGFLPGAAEAVLIGGLTYYLLNGNYYQRQGDGYVVVDRPDEPVSPQMRALDYNGERFYVAEGHYYRRDISGRYLEVPRPPGL